MGTITRYSHHEGGTFLSLIEKELVFNNLSFDSRTEALTYLANQLYENKKVKDTYKDAILAREQKFPTSLPTGKIEVAIPHADWQNVNTSTLAVATLAKPIAFHNMGDPKNYVHASIIIMLAIAEPKGQIKMLENLMSIVRNQDHLQNLISYKNNEDLYEDLDKTFNSIKL